MFSVILVLVVFAPLLTEYNPERADLRSRLQPPGSPGHILGTDQMGRDMLSRILYGGRVSLQVAFTVIPIAAIVGTFVGVTAGFFGGKFDSITMRLVDLQLSFPFLLLAITINAILGIGFRNILITLVVTRWVRFARMARGEVLKIRESDYVEAAVAAGAGNFRLIARHVLPNVLPVLIILASLEVAIVVIAEASISFLGFGVQPPTPSWGSMLSEGRDYLFIAWWLTTIPGIFLVITSLSANLVGDWLRDILDPRLRQ